MFLLFYRCPFWLTHWLLGDWPKFLKHIYKLISVSDIIFTFSEIAWDPKSTWVQLVAWCRQASSHYLSQCWHKDICHHIASLGYNEFIWFIYPNSSERLHWHWDNQMIAPSIKWLHHQSSDCPIDSESIQKDMIEINLYSATSKHNKA